MSVTSAAARQMAKAQLSKNVPQNSDRYTSGILQREREGRKGRTRHVRTGNKIVHVTPIQKSLSLSLYSQPAKLPQPALLSVNALAMPHATTTTGWSRMARYIK